MIDEIPQLVMDLSEVTSRDLVNAYDDPPTNACDVISAKACDVTPTDACDGVPTEACDITPADADRIPTEVTQRKIPISIITGYLGSGKSTLLERIGKTSSKKLAIILNEFGDSSVIEKSVSIKSKDESEAVQEWLDLGNGCLCCTVKDNGVIAIEQLLEKLGDKIDYILLETTGVADPGPIAKMFWLDDALNSRVYIDGVITVVDAEHIITCLDDVGGHWHRENKHLKEAQTTGIEKIDVDIEREQLNKGMTTAHLQIAMADTILINKIDKIAHDHSRVEGVKQRVLAINLTCPIHTTSFGDIELEKILDLHAFESRPKDLVRFLNQHTSFHDPRVATICLDFPFLTRTLQFKHVESFLQHMLWDGEKDDDEAEIHRLKGLVIKVGEPATVKVIQGVRETYDIIDDAQLVEGVTSNKLVLIGKGLNEKSLRDTLNEYLTRD